MEDNNIMIFSMSSEEKLESIGLFSADEIAALNVELVESKKTFYNYSQLAVDMESRRLVATTGGFKNVAEYVNEQYFLDKGATMHDVEGSLSYENAHYICKLNGELLWYRLVSEEQDEDPVKKAWREKNPEANPYEAAKKHVAPYVFNWTQYSPFGSRQSKITLFFLGYDTSNIKEVDEIKIDI